MASAVVEKRSPSPDKASLDEKVGHDGHVADLTVLEADMEAVGADIEEAIANAENLTDEEVREAAQHILEEHGTDPNFNPAALEIARTYIEDTDLQHRDPVSYRKVYQEMRVEAALILFNSPYAEVRATVDNHDDPTIPANTFRAWVIGLVFVAAGAFINQFFSVRTPSISVGSNVAQVLAFPAGKLLEAILPTASVTIFGQAVSLNPGPFNMKEHMVITIMANVGFGAPYTNYIVFVQGIERYFNMQWARNFGYQILIALSTNFIGYGLAGLTRRFLVYPVHAIWYNNLATIALNRAFHSGRNEVADGWQVSRLKYFLYCFCGMFVYYWFPNYIFQLLSFFNWMVWIAPNNVKLAAITGSVGASGLGLNPIPTFDVNQLGLDPWVTPFYSVVNQFAGAAVALPIICAMWFTNVWQTSHIAINSNAVWDNTGKRYNVSRVIDEQGLFDPEAYRNYSPAYLSAANTLLYGFFFAVYAATISHTFLYHRGEIARGFKSLLRRQGGLSAHKDIHSRLMSAYKEVPEYWYFSVLVISIALGAAGVGAWPTGTTPAVVLYGVFLALIFCVPIGIIYATTNAQVTLNVLAEFIGGSWFEGNALAMNFFKSYGYVTTAHTINFAQDLKLAHYTHIPPRVTFWAQIIATLVSTFVAVGAVNFQLGMEGMCDPENKDHFYCLSIDTFFTASVLWGTLGPKKMFGVGAIYSPLVYFFLIGFALPIIFFFLNKRFTLLRSIHLPVLLSGALIYAPYGINQYWPAVLIGWLFNVYIKRRYLAWWSKYNYITTTAFNAAIAISALIMFFALQYNDIEIDWVGNNIPWVKSDGTRNCDYGKCPLIKLAAGEKFGPVVGEFS
ncbi:OPT oligopeptide transporter [Auriculariales sp. MPI-PUGE-AT-0066]|nr:OPT oligopeptide transporter [Auriculariales sp. MPI-PUGE-AT-0066]